MRLSLALSGEEEAAWTCAGYICLVSLSDSTKTLFKQYQYTLCGLQMNMSIQQLEKYQKTFLTSLCLRDRVLHIHHAKFCILVVHLPNKSKAIGLVGFLERCLVYWMIPVHWSQTYLLYDSPLNIFLISVHAHVQGWAQKLWNKVGFAWPPHLCNGVRNHDIFLSSFILHFLARKCGKPPIAHGTLTTSQDQTDVLSWTEDHCS